MRSVKYCAAGVRHSCRDAFRRAALACLLRALIRRHSRKLARGRPAADARPRAGRQVAAGLGMLPGAPGSGTAPPWPAYLCVQLDGRCIGWVHARRAAGLVARLRACKAARLAAEEGPQPGVQYADITSAVGVPASARPAPAKTCSVALQRRFVMCQAGRAAVCMRTRTAPLQVSALLWSCAALCPARGREWATHAGARASSLLTVILTTVLTTVLTAAGP